MKTEFEQCKKSLKQKEKEAVLMKKNLNEVRE